MNRTYRNIRARTKQAQIPEVMKTMQALRKTLIEASRSATITADNVEAMLYDKVDTGNAFLSDPSVVDDQMLKRAIAEIDTIRSAVDQAIEASDRVKQMIRSGNQQGARNIVNRKSLRERRKAAARRLGLY